MIMKHPQDGSSEGISTLLLAAGAQASPLGKLMKKLFKFVNIFNWFRPGLRYPKRFKLKHGYL